MNKNIVYGMVIVLTSLIFISWGYEGHQIISRKSVLSFPDEMRAFREWEDYLGQHSSDADFRKGSDPNEGHKHYIDIDSYAEFVTDGFISRDYDSLVTAHGQEFVDEQGVLPWAILAMYDSLQTAFAERDFELAEHLAADLGHYVADAHMPLHLTRNYDGQFTDQYGIHYRYETYMTGLYKDQIDYDGEMIAYVENISEYVFNFIYKNYNFVDSLLAIERYATEFAGSNENMDYYSTLWYYTRDFTQQLFRDASSRLATLIYSAWINGGSPRSATSVESEIAAVMPEFSLQQNYPNPFNAQTNIGFYLPEPGNVKISICDLVGRQLDAIEQGYFQAGHHHISFDATRVSSGMYLYRIEVNGQIQVKKMCVMK